jgi:hypothetical protein
MVTFDAICHQFELLGFVSLCNRIIGFFMLNANNAVVDMQVTQLMKWIMCHFFYKNF